MANLDDREAGKPLCIHCAAAVEPTEHFCRHCGCPLTAAAFSMPYESALAAGFAYREGSAKPRKLIVVIGMWIWMLPMTVLGTVGFFGGLWASRGIARQPDPLYNSILAMLFLAICGAMAVVPGTLLYKTTRNYVLLRAAGIAAADSLDDTDSSEGDEESDE